MDRNVKESLAGRASFFDMNTLSVSEIYKAMINHLLEWEVYHWRSRDGEEIDFLIKIDQSFLFIEAKTSYQKPKDLNAFKEVKKFFDRF